MPNIGVRPTIFSWAFAQRKQSDILSPIVAANLNKMLPYREFNPAMLEKEIHSDRQYFGKGHDFASRVDLLSERIRFGRTFDATSEALSWALSLLMGSVVTTGPVGVIYTHTITFFDPATNPECLYTSIIEKAGSIYQKLISGAFVESVALTAEERQNVQLAAVLSARKQTDDATAMPAVTPSVVFRTNHATINFGATGSEVALSEEVVRWNLALGQNPDVRWVPGQTSGEEKLMRYALVGPQTVSGSITFFLSNTLRNRFLNHDRVGLTILCKGVFNVNHELKIEIPAFYINTEALAVGGQTTELTLNFSEDTVVKDAAVANTPIKITLKNEISALLV